MNMNKSSTMSSYGKICPLKLKLVSKFNVHGMNYSHCFVEDDHRVRGTTRVEAGRGLKRLSPPSPSTELLDHCDGQVLKMRAPKILLKPHGLTSRRAPRGCLANACHPGYTHFSGSWKRRLSSPKAACFPALNSGTNDSDSDTSSVGSCSVNSSSYYNPIGCTIRDNSEENTSCSDAESFRGRKRKETSLLCLEDDVAGRVHKLELHAFRSTLEALHASGPMSWEKEILLTNLCSHLNISNDEYLAELRNLLSGGTCVCTS